MIRDNPWPRTLRRWLYGLAVAGLIGWGLGYMAEALALALALGLLWQFRYISRLEYWLRKDSRFEPPHGRGLWEDIFDGIYRMQRRHRTRRKRLGTILHAFRESVDAVPDGVLVLDEGGEMRWWNAAAERLLGVRWPQDRGRRLDNLYRHPDMVNFMASEPDETRHIAVPAPLDPRLVLDIRLVPYGTSQRLLIARDITRLRKLEDMRRDFVANVSHELRTPLTVVHGLAETLAEPDGGLSEPDRDMLGLILQQTRRMNRLVEDLLMLSRLETGPRPAAEEPVDVPDMLRALAEEARALSGARAHQIELQIDSDRGLRADTNELRSAFSNLVHNAVHYTPDGGRVTLHWQCDAAGARFCVADTGIGIAPQHIPRLTERFYRVDRGRSTATGGTGLGLAIVKHILGRYDAHLEIRSTPGEGSRFCCRFPPAALSPDS